MLRWISAFVVVAILSTFTVLLLHGRYHDEGSVILVISASRGWGVHKGDLAVVGGWLLGTVALLYLAARPRRNG